MQWGPASKHRLIAWVVLSALVGTAETTSAGEVSSAASPSAKNSAPTAQQLAAAKEFFERGTKLFEQGKYDAAWFEFVSAYDMAPLSDLLFNMARTEEKLNRYADAAKHYREFLAKNPDDPDGEKIRANIALLEQKAAAAAVVLPSGTDRPRRFPVYSTIAGGGTLLFAIIGAATLGTATARFNDLTRTCAPMCSMADALDSKPTYQAGQAFLTLAAIGAVGTAGLLVWELRRGRREKSLARLADSLPQTVDGRY